MRGRWAAEAEWDGTAPGSDGVGGIGNCVEVEKKKKKKVRGGGKTG